MLKSGKSRRDTIAFTAMAYAGLSASVILVIGGWLVGLIHPSREAQHLPCNWTELTPPNNTAWENRSYRYDATWNGVHAATLKLNMRSTKHGEKTYNIVSYRASTVSQLGWAFSWSTKGATWLDHQTLLPLFAWRRTVENDEHESYWTRFHRPYRRVSHFSLESDEENPDWSQLHFVHGMDFPALFSRLGTIQFQKGEHRTFDVIEDDTAYAVHILTEQRQQLTIGDSSFTTQKLKVVIDALPTEPDSEEKGSAPIILHVWLSENIGMPVQIKYSGVVGNISAQLTSHPAP